MRKEPKLKAEVKSFLKAIAPECSGPTGIGRNLGFNYERASSVVMSSLKSLIADGIVERLENPIRYRIKP